MSWLPIEKSKLLQEEIEWCGFLIDEDWVRSKSSRTEAVMKIRPPKTVKEVRSYLGSVPILAKNINNFSAKTEPIRRLLRKDVKWAWEKPQQGAFEG